MATRIIPHFELPATVRQIPIGPRTTAIVRLEHSPASGDISLWGVLPEEPLDPEREEAVSIYAEFDGKWTRQLELSSTGCRRFCERGVSYIRAQLARLAKKKLKDAHHAATSLAKRRGWRLGDKASGVTAEAADIFGMLMGDIAVEDLRGAKLKSRKGAA